MSAEMETNSATVPNPAHNEEEITRLRARIEANPQDFDAHVSLVSLAESISAKDAPSSLVRDALNHLLQQFPLCFGYWQRLAKHEVLGNDAAPADIATLERGVSAIPHSHELWTFYCSEMMRNTTQTPEQVRSVFVRAANVIGNDSTASAFWDKYLEFELTQFASAPVQSQLQLLPPPYIGTIIAGVYAQVLTMPLRDVDKFWASFSGKFAVNYPLNFLCTPTEAEEYTRDFPKEIPADKQNYTAADGSTHALTLTDYCNEWENEARRVLLSKRESDFRQSCTARDERYQFEQGLTRSYFHVAPLSTQEIQTWHSYLDYVEGRALKQYVSTHPSVANASASVTVSPFPIDPNTLRASDIDPAFLADVIKLYERCLVPCASYGEFWDRYASFYESLHEYDQALAVRQRGLTFVQNAAKATPGNTASWQEYLLGLALCYEKLNQIAEARLTFDQAIAASSASAAPSSDSLPPVVEVLLNHIQFEKRQLLQTSSSASVISDGSFDLNSSVVQEFESALRQYDPATLPPPTSVPSTMPPTHATTPVFIHLCTQFAQLLLTQVKFSSEQDRLQHVRNVFNRGADVLFPKPVPSDAAADGTAAPTATTTTIPRVVASKQYIIFWLSFIEFESTVARSPLSVLVALYDRILKARLDLDAAALANLNPTALQLVQSAPGSAGLSDWSRRQLWTSYVSLLEERGAPLTVVEAARFQAKQSALLLSAPNTTATTAAPSALVSLLGKRKATVAPVAAGSAAVPPAKINRALPPPMAPPQRYPPSEQAYQPYQQQGYGAPYQQQGYGGYRQY